MTRIFHKFFMWKVDPMSGCDIRLVFTLPPRDSTLQYKRCVQLWNNFPYITPLKKSVSNEMLFTDVWRVSKPSIVYGYNSKQNQEMHINLNVFYKCVTYKIKVNWNPREKQGDIE